MPQGRDAGEEHRLGRSRDRFPYCSGQEDEDELLSWWLTVYDATTQTPNADIFSTGVLNGIPGVLFVEAKAHAQELKQEEGGKKLSKKSSMANHERIGEAIQEARDELNTRNPGFCICRDLRYQMSNRFAWAWRIASRGIPVALVYLGFLDAREMSNRSGTQTRIFQSEENWTSCLIDHSRAVVPESAWGSVIQTCGAPIFPLIKSMRIDPLEAGACGK
jgi:hypothetical protein